MTGWHALRCRHSLPALHVTPHIVTVRARVQSVKGLSDMFASSLLGRAKDFFDLLRKPDLQAETLKPVHHCRLALTTATRRSC